MGLLFCARASSSCGKRGPLFIAVCGPLTVAASPVVEHRLQTRRLSNCGSRAQLLRGTRDLPRPGLEPVCPALAGRFSTATPPGKPSLVVLMLKTQPLCTGAKSNPRDRILGEVEKNSFIVLPGKGGHSRLMPLKTVCPNPGGFGVEFYRSSSRVELLIRIRVCAGPAVLSSGLRWSPDELLWFSRLSNRSLLSGMRTASSSSLSFICWGF